MSMILIKLPDYRLFGQKIKNAKENEKKRNVRKLLKDLELIVVIKNYKR